VRGLLEGMAARLVAEGPRPEALLHRLEACVAEGDEILSAPKHDTQTDSRWSRMNSRFHALLVDSCGNGALSEAMARNDRLPFAAAGALPSAASVTPELRERHREVLVQAQFQHRAVVEAVREGKGARAEALMREHALQAHRNLVLFRDSIPSLAEPPAAAPARARRAGAMA